MLSHRHPIGIRGAVIAGFGVTAVDITRRIILLEASEIGNAASVFGGLMGYVCHWGMRTAVRD